jgi:ATP-binding cassette subfamily G (WHITE) protein 2
VLQLLPLRYVSIYRYSLEALAVNEFDGLTFSCGVPSPNGAPCSVPGSFFLKSQQYTHGVWTNVAVLAGMFVFYMLATFVLLRRMRKNG